MKKSISIAMIVLLVLSIISVFLIYRQYTGARDKLLNCETGLSDLNEKASQLTRKNTALHQKTIENLSRIEDLQKAQVRISEEEKAEAASAVEELKSRHETVVSELNLQIQHFDENLLLLHEKLRIKTAYARDLEAKLSKVQGESDILKQDVSALKKEKGLVEDRLAKEEQERSHAVSLVKELKSGHEAVVSKLNQEIQSLDERLSALHEKLRIKTAYARDLEAKLSRAQGEVDVLRQDLSVLTKEKRVSEDRLAKAEQERVEADSFVEQLKSRHEAVISKLSQEIVSRDDSLSALTEQKGRLEGQLAQTERDGMEKTSRLNQKIRNRDVRIAELEKNGDRLASQVDGLSRDVQAREKRIAFLEQRISDLFGEQEMLKTRIGQLETTHRSMISELQGEIAQKEVTIHELEDKLTITFVDRILFKFGRATISSEGKAILTRVGKILKTIKDRKIRVIGHTDDIPIMENYRYKFPSNWELSSARAAAVVRLFQDEIGLPPEILEAVGRSFYDPIATNETEEGRAQNRRVNIIISHWGE